MKTSSSSLKVFIKDIIPYKSEEKDLIWQEISLDNRL
jgi:hypothetical protein